MDESQLLGGVYSIPWRGKRYVFSFLTDRQRAWYVSWMKQAEFESIQQSPYLSDAQRTQLLRDFIRDVDNGEYKFGSGRAYQRLFNTERGQLRFVMMMLVSHHPDITEEDVESMMREETAAVQGVLTLVFAESSIANAGIDASGKQLAIEEVYRQLMKSPLDGGAGLTREQIADMTDRQKIKLLVEESKPEPTQHDTAKIDAVLRSLAAK